MAKENNIAEPEKVQTDLPEVEQELSKVATNPKQSIIILVVVAGVFLYLFFNLFVGSGDTPKQTSNPIPDNVVKPVQIPIDTAIPAIPALPTPPKLEDPALPPPPPVPATQDVMPPSPLSQDKTPLPMPESSKDVNLSPANPTLPLDIRSQSDEAKKKLEAKRKSAIVLIAGAPKPKTPEQVEQETDFKQRGDMHLILGRGKMLDAIIESAVNTDFGGEIRAIISRDVYSEWGRNILIPKGSRVFGTYNTGTNGAYGRIAIEWTRIDLPTTGYTINFGGTGMDNLGRKGQQGRVDNKFKERFSNAVLRSAFNIALASTLDSIVKPVESSQSASTQSAAASATSINTACTTIPVQQASATPAQKLAALVSAITTACTTASQESTASTTPSQTQTASTQAFKDITDVAKELLEKQKFDPTITIDQGTLIKIYVNKDYKFPKAAIKNVMK